MKLAIVIPALNEEQSIESTILRTLNSEKLICKDSGIDSVSIVVVSDGSTDNTVSIASKYTGRIKLVVFEKNRGYGCAIKEGWNAVPDAELRAFLDADGTGNPDFFVDLCSLFIKEGADIAFGSRLGKQSEMPAVRRICNTGYSVLLSIISS